MFWTSSPTYLKSYNKFYEDISIAKGISGQEIFRFSDIIKIQRKSQSATKKIIPDGKEMSESIDHTDIEYAFVEDFSNMYRTA